MRLSDRLLVVLADTGARPKVPSHLDCLLGAARPVGRVGDRVIDRVLAHGEDYVVTGVYHARASLGRVGEQARDFDDVEEGLGLSRTYSVRLADPARTPEVVDRLRQLQTVERASVQTLAVTPFDVEAPARPVRALPPGVDPWAPHERVGARRAHDLEPGDQSVWVGLVDTGISLPHPEFRRKLLAGYDTVQLGMGRDFGDVSLVGDSAGEDFSPRDEVGHGSHVGGVIGAHGWRLPPGVAGQCMLLPIRVLAAAREHGKQKLVGVGAESDINAGLKVAVDMGADVLNLSFGTPASAISGTVSQPHHDVIRYATHYGCTLVAAMGNSGVEEAYYPAAYPEVIAVGSVDEQGRRSAFSTIGAHIALSAPGENIVSAGRRGYEAGSGTSFAAPFVSGAAALLVAGARRRGRKLRGTEVKTLLMDSARPVAGAGPDIGAGVLDIVAALGRLEVLLGQNPSPGRA